MPSRRIPDPLPPDWPAAKALTQLRLQLDALQRFKSRGYPDAKAEHSSWFNEVAMILRHAFGIQHPNYSDFQSSGYAVGQYRQYEREEVKEQLNFDARVRKEESCLNTYIRELELMLPTNRLAKRLQLHRRMLALKCSSYAEGFTDVLPRWRNAKGARQRWS
jgi:hypothetical protein